MREVGRPSAIADERRQVPLFTRHVLSGRTYTTRRGAVIPNELQYYDGEMLQIYGECTNVSGVNLALAGSGYRAVTLRHRHGALTAPVQLWVSRFTQSTIGTYEAMFLVVVAAREEAPDSVASVPAHADGAASALMMLDGSYDATAGIYENRRRLFLVRLLDSTAVAIDVGRERMGTDKRPGTISLQHHGADLVFAIADERGAAVARGRVAPPQDSSRFIPALTRAAETAHIRLHSPPAGTEFVYPSVARIGRGPVVQWDWRSDTPPVLQAVPPDAVAFSPKSEEGRLALSWGFTAKAAGYIAHVRGAITGLADSPACAPAATRPVHVSASEPRKAASRDDEPKPRWAWETKFFGSLTAVLRKELVGPTPDGLRINWYVTEGSFSGPGFEAVVLPGAADWMRIRRDGVAIVSVQACFELKNGARVYGSYGGVFDLGPDGYTRALRNDFDPLPPVVVTPTYATADPELAWLNRAQCIGVGRVDMSVPRVEFDVYLTRVGGPLGDNAGRARDASVSAPRTGTLYARMGGYDVVAAIADDFLVTGYSDRQLSRYFQGQSDATRRMLRQHVVNLLCELTGGSAFYFGRDMKTTHRGLGITASDWRVAFNLFEAAVDKHRLGARERTEFLQLIADMKDQIIERP